MSQATRNPRSTIPGWLDRLAVAGAAVLALALVAPRVDPITRDSAAYLDVARNLLAGEGLVQRIVDFWRPAIPDPLGLWPPLYPLLVAGLAALGAPLEVAARAISAVSFLVFALALHALARRMVGRIAALAAAITALAHPVAVVAGTSIWSESTYLALVTLGLSGLAALHAAPSRDAPSPRIAAASGLCLGLAAVTRYQGLPLVVLGLAILLLARPSRRTLAAWALPALAPPALWIVTVIATSAQLGPTPADATRAPGEAAAALLGALRWGFLPGPLAASAPVAAALLAAVALGVTVAFGRGGAAAIAAACAALSLATLLVADARGLFQTLALRFVIPIAPFLWLTSAVALEALVRRAPRLRVAAGAVAAALVAISALGIVSVVRDWPDPPAGAIARALEGAELRALVPPGAAPVLSNAGHELRLATGRSAVQVPEGAYRLRDFSAADEERWRARGVREAVFRLRPQGASLAPDERFGRPLAARVGLAPGDAWAVVDSSATFVRYRIAP